MGSNESKTDNNETSLKDYIEWNLNIDIFELEKNNNEKVTRKADKFYR